MSATPALAPPDVLADEVVPPSVVEDAAVRPTPLETPPAEPTTRTPSHSPRDSEPIMERVRRAALPPALRERLIAAMESSGDQPPSVEQVLAAVEESLPEFLREGGPGPQRPEHPAGEAFFRGSEELSDAEADRIAREQLARSGLLRGQRVRVAD